MKACISEAKRLFSSGSETSKFGPLVAVRISTIVRVTLDDSRGKDRGKWTV